MVDKLFSEQLSQEDKEIQSILRNHFNQENERLHNIDKEQENKDVNIVDSNEVQKNDIQNLHSSTNDISPRHPELSYYENEKNYIMILIKLPKR